MAATVLDYTIDRGEVWEHFISIKDRRTRRPRVPSEAAATFRIEDGEDAGDYDIPCEIVRGGVLMTLTAEQTQAIEPGVYAWDMVVTVNRTPTYSEITEEELVLVKGNLTVQEYDNITPMESDD